MTRSGTNLRPDSGRAPSPPESEAPPPGADPSGEAEMPIGLAMAAFGNHDVTDYMRCVLKFFEGKPPMRILDIPAGSGALSVPLRKMGHTVVCADIIRAHQDYVHVDMNRDFPFPDQSFDAVVCLEGLEHMLEPDHLLKELLRVCRVGGAVVLSTPNVQNFYSRVQFLLTGTFYQFIGSNLPVVGRHELADRAHIAPITYLRLRYMAGYFGARIEAVGTDKPKRKILLPLYRLIWALGLPRSRRIFFGSLADRSQSRRNHEMHRDLNSPALLFGRSMVVFLRKEEHVSRMPSGESA
jgi:SAM-dependent methyltransferase